MSLIKSQLTNLLINTNPQGSDEWKLARLGLATGSRASDILAKIKTGEAAKRRDYRIELVTERLTGKFNEDVYVSKEMQWGTQQEPFARMAYEEMKSCMVHECGFVSAKDKMAGCSVDGFLEDQGMFGLYESKCPKSSTHIAYLKDRRLPPDHEPQVTHNMYITGAQFSDFVSFDPRLPENLQLFVIRVMRDESKMKAYELELMTFLAEVKILENELRNM